MQNLIEDKNYAPKKLGKVCVLGLGKTGFAVANYLCPLLGDRVKHLHIYAGGKNEFAMKSADKFLKDGASVSFDDDVIDKSYDLCIASPGIPEVSNLIKSAKKNCTEVISEIEFAWRESSTKAKWIAITGTNGKTTTTELTTHILQSAGKHALSVGNVGNVAIEAVASDMRKSLYEHTDIFVTEVSSYQLALCDKFSADVACLLNITPDHIDWHGSFDKYKTAKLNAFKSAKYGVVNMDDTQVESSIETIKRRVKNHLIRNTFNDKILSVNFENKNHEIISIDSMRIIGEHNCCNARAAASICLILGLSDTQIKDGIASFLPLEHRLENCGIIAGVRLYNDSKATNVDSTLVAIGSFEPRKAIFMMGGRDKNTSLDELANKVSENLKGVVVYGEAKDRFYEALQKKQTDGNFTLDIADNMKSAFKIAMEKAYPGDFVVLSPACSSFDEFKSFEERGKVFKELVEKCK